MTNSFPNILMRDKLIINFMFQWWLYKFCRPNLTVNGNHPNNEKKPGGIKEEEEIYIETLRD